ncbi:MULTISPECIES: MerR family transcriptional regulator [Actinoplanes]|uniref:MerR family transcriptional regulator n=1 Tax=Actinoplanes TaxID=1865 RepID=UPI0005F28F96|nr:MULTISPECIES: MerR family transcriptional regulator [Actinoplanes]GLY04689.1 MerR family transcriptional regulator [Actinoplanes sp. NBRC 101535]
MRIGDLAAKAGVSVRAIRYYEEQQLLVSERSTSGQRHYRAEHVERVGFIQRLYAAGLSSRTIAELLPCTESPSLANSDAAMIRMTEERARLDERIDDLVRARDALDRLMGVAAGFREQLPAA